jgi:arsenite methyltransferase
MSDIKTDEIHKSVRDHYGRLAEQADKQLAVDCCGDSSGSACCDNVTLYEVDTAWLPNEMTGFSLGCGDPIALAELEQGQTVLDLGSGGGLDCFLAAERVGADGYVIGIDMTPAMMAKANRNKEKLGLANVEFRQGQIEALPVGSETIDVIISNCVINLSPDKPAVFSEAYRVLRQGGRLAVSDIVTQGHFSNEERANMDAWAGCVTGAETVEDYVAALQQAGFVNVSVRDKADPAQELAGLKLAGGAARPFSARITAEKAR